MRGSKYPGDVSSLISIVNQINQLAVDDGYSMENSLGMSLMTGSNA